jgi:hypothetical protein
MRTEDRDQTGVGIPASDDPADRAIERHQNPERRFTLIFITVVALTLLTLILNVVLALIGGDTEAVETASETCSTTYKMGFGAIVALLGSSRAP